jgi:GntR family transcriptional repressor for pyruvate dehydrogenase complex
VSTPQRQKRISDEITERLQNLVLSDNLRPGDRLPPERQLADMFGVSRNSVREAIKSLEQRGILVSRPGAGTFIVDTSQADLASALGEVFARERHRLDDIFELRLLLEPQITYLAAQRITAEELENLHKIMADYVRTLRAYQPVQGIDQSFHDAIAAATGNQSVILLMEKMHDLMHESRDEALQSPIRNERSLQDHLKILDALGMHDAERAREAMQEHLEHTREIVFTSTSGE